MLSFPLVRHASTITVIVTPRLNRKFKPTPVGFFLFSYKFKMLEYTDMMTEELHSAVKRSVLHHEGRSKFPYTDTRGNITIGIGYNLSDRGVSDKWINEQYEEDVQYFYSKLFNDFDWFNRLNNDRKVVLIDMIFNLGYKNFLSFKRLISALSRDDYKEAAHEMLESKWAHQVKNRANELANAMLTGVYKI